MDPATIQQIAAEVVARLPFGDRLWLVLVVNAIIAALIGALVVLGTSYLRTRAQNLATKHDFDELLKQLKANTELVEAIKSEVGQRDWAQREWTNLRRTKLEALLEKMNDCEAVLDRLRNRAIKGEFELEHDPVSQLDAIGTLYFPELHSEVFRFSQQCRQQAMMGLDHGKAVMGMGGDLNAYQTAHQAFKERWNSTYPELLEARAELTDAARRLLVKIMGVED
jgi:hypothetical protein